MRAEVAIAVEQHVESAQLQDVNFRELRRSRPRRVESLAAISVGAGGGECTCDPEGACGGTCEGVRGEYARSDIKVSVLEEDEDDDERSFKAR